MNYKFIRVVDTYGDGCDCSFTIAVPEKDDTSTKNSDALAKKLDKIICKSDNKFEDMLVAIKEAGAYEIKCTHIVEW